MVKTQIKSQASRLMATLFAAVITVGCAPKPPPDFYLLNTAAPAMLPGFEKGLRVGLGPIEVQDYLNRNQIVSLETTTRLRLSERSVWAEPVKAGLTRVLLVNLGLALDSNRIYALPMRQRRPLDYQIPIDVLRYDGVLGAGNEVVLSARWTLLSGDGKDVLLTKVSRIQEPVAGDGVDDFVDAQSRAAAELSREIASAIQSRQR